jgi:hypothetical protein
VKIEKEYRERKIERERERENVVFSSIDSEKIQFA